MSEENQNQPTENPSISEEGRDINSTASLVERADSAVKRLEETEKRVTEKIKILEELEARRILGGKSQREDTPREKTTDEVIDEQVEKALNRFK